MKERKLYIYEGPVIQFGNVIKDIYRNGTQASSVEEAMRNLTFTCKRKLKMVSSSKISLDPKYLMIDESYICS